MGENGGKTNAIVVVMMKLVWLDVNQIVVDSWCYDIVRLRKYPYFQIIHMYSSDAVYLVITKILK